MAKVTGPLLSLSASGTIARTQTYAKWRGISYVRQRVVPANPRSTAQVLTRDIFTAMGQRWKQGGPLMRAPWERYASGQRFLGSNAYLGQNLNAMRGEVDMDAYIGSPGAKGGLPAATLVLTTVASLGIEAVVTVPATPTGWTLQGVVCTAMKEQLPEATVSDVVQEGEDLTAAPYQVDFTGLVAVEYQVQAWIRWLKDNSTIAYGASISDQIIVTA